MERGTTQVHTDRTLRRSYPIEEVMEMLGVCRQTIYKLIQRGDFRAFIVGGKYRIIKVDFDKWLDGEKSEVQ